MKKNSKYYDIITQEGANEATMLLYGAIGESIEYDPEEGWKDTGIKDIDFVNELAELARKYPVIHIRINSPGGEIFHGSAIVTAIRTCPAEVNTWIDGVAASMAGMIWLAGKKRHMAKNGMLMLHSASGLCWGNAADMREIADTLDQFDKTLIISAADSTGMSEDDLKAKYFDYKDHWLTWNEVNAEGWLSSPDDYQSAAPMPKDIQNMSYRALCEFFNEKKNPEANGLLHKLKAAWDHTIAAVTGGNSHPPLSPTDILKMNLEEFKNSVGDGTLSLSEVKAHIASLEPAPAPAPTPEPAPAPEPAVDPAITDAIAELKNIVAAQKTTIDTLAAQVAAFGAQPGAGKSAPQPPDQPLPGAENAAGADAAALYAKMNADLARAADRNESVNIALGE